MKLNIATLITLAVVDHSPYRVLATAKTSEYETETISKQEDDAVSVLPLLRGVKKAVYQFLSDSDSEELSCGESGQACVLYANGADSCCGRMMCTGTHPTSCSCVKEGDACMYHEDCCGYGICNVVCKCSSKDRDSGLCW